MPAHFTLKQQDEIRENLFKSGIRMLKYVGARKMTVSALTKECGIAKGSFYSFYQSKEEYLLALIEYADKKTSEMIAAKLCGRKQMSVHEFFEFFREYLYSDYDLMNSLTIDDFLWLKKAFAKQDFFNPEKSKQTGIELFSFIENLRSDIDMGVVVNLIKSVYALREHRTNMVESSLDASIDIILKSLEKYVLGDEL